MTGDDADPGTGPTGDGTDPTDPGTGPNGDGTDDAEPGTASTGDGTDATPSTATGDGSAPGPVDLEPGESGQTALPGDGSDGSDPGGRAVTYTEGDDTDAATVADPDREPLSGLADRIDEGDVGEPTDEVDDLFDRETVGEIDRDRLWQRLEEEELPDPDLDGDRDVREIDAHAYCHGCDQFAEPPEVACRHEGTTILEMPSLGTFRVADCPVVLEERRLEEGGS